MPAHQFLAKKEKPRLNYEDIFNTSYFKQLSLKEKQSLGIKLGADEGSNPFMKFEDHQSSSPKNQRITFQMDNSIGSYSNKIAPISKHLQVPGG